MKKTYLAPTLCIKQITPSYMLAISITSVNSTEFSLGDDSDEEARVKGEGDWDDIWSE